MNFRCGQVPNTTTLVDQSLESCQTEDGVCLNFLLEVWPDTDFIQCHEKCVENPKCNWISVHFNNNICYLTQDCKDVVLQNQGYIRAKKNCMIDDP